MNDTEKSDAGVVAEKSTNKVGQPAAESVEPRPETKGNAEQLNTIYEGDFCGFSYGFRPGRGPHNVSKVKQPASGVFDCVTDVFRFVCRQIVHDDDVAWCQG
ncbi:hypothetical protein O8C22_11630 [Agrobacterium rhizogenes]|nr:hypothetical protein [Rhizobium rhizogenes]